LRGSFGIVYTMELRAYVCFVYIGRERIGQSLLLTWVVVVLAPQFSSKEKKMRSLNNDSQRPPRHAGILLLCLALALVIGLFVTLVLVLFHQLPRRICRT
jgi:hypothetical protein